MSAGSRRAARGEQRVADAVDGERVKNRPRFASAPDILPRRLPTGEVLQLEVKSTKRLPKRVLAALEQARRYTPSAIPIAVFVPFGGRAIACLALEDLARLVGLRAAPIGEQLALLGGPR